MLRLARLAGRLRRRLPLRGEVRQQRGQALPVVQGAEGGQIVAAAVQELEVRQAAQPAEPRRQRGQPRVSAQDELPKPGQPPDPLR
jgi:hypothetical protein